MNFFTGKFLHTMDGQRRISIPKAWRGGDAGTDTFVLIPGLERRIHVMTIERFERLLVTSAERVAFGNSDEQDMLEALGSQSLICGCDKQGRITLSEELKDHAQLEGEAMLTGAVSDFRIYRPDVWDARKLDPAKTFDTLSRIQKGG